MDHHLQNSIHVACLTKVKQPSYTTATTWPLRRVGCQVGVVFFSCLGELTFQDLAIWQERRFVDEIVAAATVDRLLAYGERVVGLGEVFVEVREASCNRAVETSILCEVVVQSGLVGCAVLADFIDGTVVKMLAASYWHVEIGSHSWVMGNLRLQQAELYSLGENDSDSDGFRRDEEKMTKRYFAVG